MKKLLIIFAIFLSFGTTILASGERMMDRADIFSDHEEIILLEKINELEEKHDISFVIYTDDNYVDAIGRTAADVYDYGGYTENGVMLYINMANREYFVLTSGGKIIRVLSDYGLDEVNKSVENELRYQNYYRAGTKYLEGIDRLLDYYYEHGEAYDINNENTKLEKVIYNTLICSTVLTAAFAFFLNRQLKTEVENRNATVYADEWNNPFCKAKITNSKDIFLYKTVSKRKIERNSNSGGSSTFRGSSGKTHGGRGGSF